MRLLGMLFSVIIIVFLAMFLLQRYYGVQTLDPNSQLNTSLPAVTGAVGQMQDKVTQYDKTQQHFQESFTND